MKLSLDDLLEETVGQGWISGLDFCKHFFLMCMLGRKEYERYSVWGSGLFLVKNPEEVLF